MLLPLLNEGHLVDLFERCQAVAHFGKSGIPQESHPFVAGDAFDFRRRPTADDHLTDVVGQVQQFGDRTAATEARTGAFQAADSLDKLNLGPEVRIESRGAQHFRRIAYRSLAVHTYDTHQSLRQNTIQGRDEVVRFNSHVNEAADNVGNVVRMHGRKYQVSDQRGLNRYLRCFIVSNFADHDFVRVVAQDGTQSASKRQPFFLINGNLRDAANLIFNGVFDGDDLVFVGFNLVDSGVQSGRFTRAGWARDQHHSVWLADVPAKLPHIVLRKAHHVQTEVGNLFRQGFLVKNAKDRVFPVAGGHDGNAKVHETALVTNAESPVLRNTPLGDVQFAHHLDAGNDCGEPILGNWRHRMHQDAVNSIFNGHLDVAGFDVNVRCTPLESSKNNGVHQADHRADCRLSREAIRGKSGVRFFLIFDDRQGKRFGRLIEYALGLFGPLQQVSDLRRVGNFKNQLLAQQQRKFVAYQYLSVLRDR